MNRDNSDNDNDDGDEVKHFYIIKLKYSFAYLLADMNRPTAGRRHLTTTEVKFFDFSSRYSLQALVHISYDETEKEN